MSSRCTPKRNAYLIRLHRAIQHGFVMAMCLQMMFLPGQTAKKRSRLVVPYHVRRSDGSGYTGTAIDSFSIRFRPSKAAGHAPSGLGISWTILRAYLRGLAYNQRVSSRWGTALIWVAFLIMLVWGTLWAAHVYGAYSLTPQGSGAWWLAVAHIAPIAAISFCSAMAHQVATRYEQERAQEQERWRQTLERQREQERQELARQHEQQLQQLEIERERRRLDDEQAYRLMKLGEEQRTLRAQRRGNQGATNQATKRSNPLDGVDVVAEVEALGSAAKVAAKYGCSRQAVDKRLHATSRKQVDNQVVTEEPHSG